MLGLRNHSFLINEGMCNGLFNILETIEEKEIRFILKDNCIIIDSSDCINHWNEISCHLKGNELIEVYRNGTKEPVRLDIKSGWVRVDNLWFNKDGKYRTLGDTEEHNIKKLLSEYPGNNKSIDELRRFMCYGLYEEDYLNELRKSRFLFTKFKEIAYSFYKLKMSKPINVKKFRCIEWSENGEYGIWTTPKKYIINELHRRYRHDSILPRGIIIDKYKDIEPKFSRFHVNLAYNNKLVMMFGKNIKKILYYKEGKITFDNVVTIPLEEYKFTIRCLVKNGFIDNIKFMDFLEKDAQIELKKCLL